MKLLNFKNVVFGFTVILASGAGINAQAQTCSVIAGSVTTPCSNLLLGPVTSTTSTTATITGSNMLTGTTGAAIIANPGSGLSFGVLTINGASAGMVNGGLGNPGIEIQSGSGTIYSEGPSVKGAIGLKVDSGATVTTFNNFSGTTLTGLGSSPVAVSNLGTIASFINGGTVTDGISNQSGGTITSIQNNGSMNGNVNSSITNAGNIGTITNINGSMYNSSGWADINNTAAGATISNLINGQGAGNAHGALNYAGALPTNYNIYIQSTSSYGQLAVTSGTGTTAFGIAAGSNVSAHLYTAVISGISSASYFTTSSGTYLGLSWNLIQEGTSGIWDILFGAPAPSGPSSTDTQTSINYLASQLQSTYAIQASLLNTGLTYDCPVFDKNGICISAGAGYTAVNSGTPNVGSGLLIGGYKLNDQVRLGAWVNQKAYNTGTVGLNAANSNPMFGLYAVWNQDKSGKGLEVRASAGYETNTTTSTRQVFGTSEAGVGSASLTTQGASLVASYNIPTIANLVASPYVGVRYSKVGLGGYTESSGASSAPLTYGDLNQESTTVLAGVKVSGKFDQKIGVFGSVGVEQDLQNNAAAIQATGSNQTLTNASLTTSYQATRPVVTVGAYYELDKTQRVSLNAGYAQSAYQPVAVSTAYVTYTAGF